MELRDYQIKAVQEVYEHWKNGIRSILLYAPTGAGKTALSSQVVKAAVKKGHRVLFLVHRDSLVSQTTRTLRKFGLSSTGYIKAGYPHYSTNDKIIIASIQTLGRRELPPDVKLVVVDEAHTLSYFDVFKDIKEKYEGTYYLGLTASPWRLKKKEYLGQHYDEIVKVSSPKELTERGYLVPFRCFGFGSDINWDNIKLSTSGEFDAKEVGKYTDELLFNEFIIQKWKEIAYHSTTICFANSIDQSILLCELFNKIPNIKAAHIDADTPINVRDKYYEKLASKEINTLVSVGTLTEGFDCLDSETEVLTPNGWKNHETIKTETNVYSLNKKTQKMELTQIEKIINREVNENEKMIWLKSQHINIRVTENHEFHVKKYWGARRSKTTDYQTIKAKDLEKQNNFILPLAAEYDDFPGLPLTNDEIRFIAWCITDTHITKKGSLQITQSEVKFHERIRNLIKRLGFDFTERLRKPSKGSYQTKNSAYTFYIPKGNHTGKYARKGYIHLEKYLDKKISPLLHQMTKEQFLVFWEELMYGNGTGFLGNKSGWLCCTYKEQSDAFCQMAVLRGLSVSSNEELTKNNYTYYLVSIRNKNSITINPKDIRATKIIPEKPTNNEKVWCVTNKNSTLVTRRKGKIAIIGNCAITDCIVLARPTKSTSLYIQMVGRGGRIAPNKQSCLVLDFCGNVQRHGFPADERGITLEQIYLPQPAPMKECPECETLVYMSAQTCPECGYVFSSLESHKELPSLEDVLTNLKDSFGELLTEEKRLHAKWYRKKLKQAYEEDQSPLYVQREFWKKYKYNADNNWHTYAVFGGDNSDFNKFKYKSYLEKTLTTLSTTPTEQKINHFMRLEFGRQ